MKRRIIAAAFGVLGVSAANAEISLEKVATPCGTPQEVRDLLGVRMPSPQTLGKGGGSRGDEVAVLLAGDDYWALVATMAPGRVCIVASGRNWTKTEAGF